jgi:aminoglycoside phosphotransferase (APT) family kinase protein
VTVVRDEVIGLLRSVWPGVTAGPLAPLSGGFWATMFRVQVSGQPDGVPGDVVVRLAPHRTMGAKEAEVQRAVAGQGLLTPKVWVSRPDEARGGWWSVMDFSPGRPLLAGLDGVAALRRAPSLLRTLPSQLAQTAAAVHRVDPAPVTTAVRRAAPEAAWSARDNLEHLRLGAAAAGRTDLAAALGELGGRLPDDANREVVCHGDLHPFNVLDGDGGLVVLDWTGAVVADPCFDVAFTELLLANPPLVLPGPLAPVGRRAGCLLARRFVAAYTRANPGISLAPLSWYRALHSARVLVEVENRRAQHGPDAGGHPFTLLAPVAAAHLATATGIDVRA